MIEITIGLIITTLTILILKVYRIDRKLDWLDELAEEEEEETSHQYQHQHQHHADEGADADKELTQHEIRELKKFVRDYLVRELKVWELGLYNLNHIDNKPVKSRDFQNFIREVERLEHLILNPEKLEKEKEKARLKEEIENKQKELDNMD